jgi:hypothetical protein
VVHAVGLGFCSAPRRASAWSGAPLRTNRPSVAMSFVSPVPRTPAIVRNVLQLEFPRSVKSSPEPATKSVTVLETRTSRGLASRSILAAVSTRIRRCRPLAARPRLCEYLPGPRCRESERLHLWPLRGEGTGLAHRKWQGHRHIDLMELLGKSELAGCRSRQAMELFWTRAPVQPCLKVRAGARQWNRRRPPSSPTY